MAFEAPRTKLRRRKSDLAFRRRLFFRSAVFFISIPITAAADPVYSWIDKNGVTHYATAPHANKAGGRVSEAELPQIQYRNIENDIATLTKESEGECQKHGGIDCTRGETSNGSAQCAEHAGVTSAKFDDHCLEARLSGRLFLEIAGSPGQPRTIAIREVTDRGVLFAAQAFVLRVRNGSAIAAKSVVVEIWTKLAKLRRLVKYKAIGPDSVDGYGAADYRFDIGSSAEELDRNILQETTYSIRCSNCGAIPSDS